METVTLTKQFCIAQPITPGTEDSHTAELLNTMVGMCKKKSAIEWIEAAEQNADVVIFPDDASQRDLSRYPSSVVIVATMSESQWPVKNARRINHVLRKPLRVMQIVELLNALVKGDIRPNRSIEISNAAALNSRQASSGAAQSAGASNASSKPLAAKPANPTPANRPLTPIPNLPELGSANRHWQLALELKKISNRQPSNTCYKIFVDGIGTIWASDGLVWCKTCENFFDNMAAQKPVGKIFVEKADRIPPGSQKTGFELFWRCCISLTRDAQDFGPWLDTNSNFKISRWPDLGLLRADTSVVKLISSLSQTAYSPKGASERLDMSPVSTLSIFNALAASELLRAFPRENVSEPETKKSATGGLNLVKMIGSLRRHLSL